MNREIEISPEMLKDGNICSYEREQITFCTFYLYNTGCRQKWIWFFFRRTTNCSLVRIFDCSL